LNVQQKTLIRLCFSTRHRK